jgi:GT2 family glycosyltransferase
VVSERTWYGIQVSCVTGYPRGSHEALRRVNLASGSKEPFVVALVLNWNNLPDTLECVDSVRCSDYSNLAVWVVDNDSQEDPTAVLHERYPDLRVLRNPRNLGYGGGNNTGLKWAIDEGAAYVLLLNNDVVVAPDCVRRLVTAAEADRRIGMATPKVFYYDRPAEVYWDGGIVDWESGEAPHESRGLPVAGGIVKSEWLDGCSLLVRVATVREVGLLDERYFLYFEDTDWSVRAARRGWMNAVVLEARAWHKVNRTAGGFANPVMRFYHFRNRYLFVTAHGPSRGRLRWRLRYAWIMCSGYMRARHEREGRQVFLAVLVDLLRGRSGPYETTGIGRQLVVRLDALLVFASKSAKPIKRLLQWIGRMLT